jgi:hypothetical protein
MTSLPLSTVPSHPAVRSRSTLRLLVPVLVFAIAFAAVIGGRALVSRHQDAVNAVAASAGAGVAFPTSAAIEDKWGVRFTAINVLADGGMVELRYLVLDPTKGGRIHSGNVADLPYLHAEASGLEVRSQSLMFHVHTDHAGPDVVGRAYSLIYGNSNGAVRMNGLVTIVLPDGLRLEHVPVS